MTSQKFQFNYLLPKYWLSWLAVAISYLLARLPLSWQGSLARKLSQWLANSGNSRMHIIRRNIARCFPAMSSEEQRQLVTANVESSVLMMFDLLNFIWRQPNALIEPTRVVGEEHLRRALADNKPLLLVSGHFTPLFRYLSKLASITPFDAIYRRLDNPLMEAHLYQRGIAKHPINTFHRKDIGAMLKKLADQGTVVIVPDQDFGLNRGVFIDFFGIPTATVTTIPQYAKQTGAEVMLFSAYREGMGCVVEFDPVLPNYPSGDDVADTQIWSDWLERKIRQHPCDYLWIHKRFKTRPEGETNFYQKN